MSFSFHISTKAYINNYTYKICTFGCYAYVPTVALQYVRAKARHLPVRSMDEFQVNRVGTSGLRPMRIMLFTGQCSRSLTEKNTLSCVRYLLCPTHIQLSFCIYASPTTREQSLFHRRYRFIYV